MTLSEIKIDLRLTPKLSFLKCKYLKGLYLESDYLQVVFFLLLEGTMKTITLK